MHDKSDATYTLCVACAKVVSEPEPPVATGQRVRFRYQEDWRTGKDLKKKYLFLISSLSRFHYCPMQNFLQNRKFSDTINFYWAKAWLVVCKGRTNCFQTKKHVLFCFEEQFLHITKTKKNILYVLMI